METIREYATRIGENESTIRSFLKKNKINTPVIDGLKRIGEFELKRISTCMKALGKTNFSHTNYNKKMNIRQL